MDSGRIVRKGKADVEEVRREGLCLCDRTALLLENFSYCEC
jgi:hypothetical protein